MFEVPPFIPPLRPEQEPSIRVLSGRALAREVRKQDAVSRAMLAAELTAGRIVLEKLTPKQAQQLTHSSYGYACAARRLSPLERSAVRSGHLKLANVARRLCKPLTDAKLD